MGPTGRLRWLQLSAMCCGFAGMVGCGFGTTASVQSPGASPTSRTYTGHVHGGQQPVSGSQVYLYAASQTADAGSAASLLASPGYVVTDANGNFTVTSGYTCPAGSYVYLLALGGNPGLSGTVSNSKLALAAGLGSCAGLSSSTFVSINEVTTVATAYALAAFASSETQVGFAAVPNMTAAFGSIPAMVNTTSGGALAATPTGNGIVQQAKINSLADSVATCVNSDGTGSACSRLLADTGVSSSGTTPADTFQAMLNLALNPTANTTDIYTLAGSSPPFEPTLSSAPADWSLPILFPGAVTVSAGPSSVTVPQTGELPVSATVSGASGTPFSYKWSVAGNVATLFDSLHQQTTICSPSSQVLYIPQQTALTANTQDSYQAQLYTGAGCLPGNAVSTSSSAAVTISIQPPSSTVPSIPAGSFTSAVQLPSGVAYTPNQLTVLTSAGSVTPLASGTFSVPVYSTGPQIAEVLAPDGSPLLLGWLDSTHAVISAGTTAEVMAYIALGGPLMFQPADRTVTEAAILNAPGLTQLTSTITSELQNNPDAFASNDANLQAALNTFFQGISGVTPRTYAAIKQGLKPELAGQPKPAILHPRPEDGNGATGLLITPGDQSGVEVNSSDSLNAINAVNTYRRRSHVFVQQVSDTDASGNVVPDTSVATDFELSPTVGLNAGVSGAIGSIFNYYYGAGTTAYAPVTSDDISVPVAQNYSKSTYQVTVVGAGHITSTYNSLPSNIATTQVQVAIGGFVEDALVPLFSNLFFGSGFNNGFSQSSTAFEVDWAKDIEQDIFANLSNLQSFQQEVQSGGWGAAMSDVIDDVRGSGTFRSILIDSLEQAAAQTASGSQAFVSTSGANLLNSLGVILGAAGGILQVFDSSVYVVQLSQSDSDDEWTVVNGGQKVTLTANSGQIEQFGQGTDNLTTALPGVDTTTGYSYLYSNTGNAGSIAPADGSGSPAKSFCTSSSAVTYSAFTSPLLTQPVTDTVSVTAFSGGNCVAANAVGKAATATETVSPDQVTTDPSSVALTGSQSVTVNGYIPSVNNGSYSFLYQLSGTPGSALVTTLTDNGGAGVAGTGATGTSLCLSETVPSSYVTVSLSGTVGTSTILNKLNLSAYSGSGCAAANLIGTALAVPVQVAPVGLLLQPRKASVPQNKSLTYSAIFQDGTTTSGYNASATYSYEWSFAGENATLQDKGTAYSQPFCTTDNEVIFVPASAPVLTQKVTGSVSVQAFSGSTCASNSALSATLTTPVTVTPALIDKPLSLEHAVYGVLQAWDGNFYASSAYNGTAADLYGWANYVTNQYCTQNVELGVDNPCGSLYRITPAGAQTDLHDFLPSTSDPDTPQLGLYPTPMQQGPDGALYGITAEGYFFRQGLDGAFSVLSTLGVANLPSFNGLAKYSLNSAPQYILLLGSDGLFYVPIGGGIGRVGIDGSFSSTPFSNPAIGGILAAVEDTDSKFYAVAADANNGNVDPADQIFHFISFDRNGNVTDLYTFPVTSMAGTAVGGGFTGSPLIELPNGNFVFHDTSAFYLLNQTAETTLYSEPYVAANLFRNSSAVETSWSAGGTATLDAVAGVDAFEPDAPAGDTMILASDGKIYGASETTVIVNSTQTGYQGGVSYYTQSYYPVDASCTVTPVTGLHDTVPQDSYTGLDYMQSGCNGLFQLDPSSTDGYSDLYSFAGGDDGDSPVSTGYTTTASNNADGPVIQDSLGNLVGTAFAFRTTKHPAQAGTMFVISNNLPAPIQLNLTSGGQTVSQTAVNQPVTLSWSVLNAFSGTAQQCYAFVQPQPDGTASTGAGTWTGKQTGQITQIQNADGTTSPAYAGSYVITPTASGTYTYALTCGGRESGFATLTVQ